MSNIFTQPRDTEMTSELLTQAIAEHSKLVPHYLKRKKMYEGLHDILEQEAKEKYKPDNRLVVNFAKYIVDTFNGYFIGNPIKVSHDNEKVNKYLDFLDGYNDQDDNNAELSKICSIYGHGYELIFADETAKIGLTYLTPMDAFMIYDDSIREIPLYAVRYFKNKDGLIEGTFSDNRNVTYFVSGKDGFVFDEPKPHNFDGVPMIEYVENEEKKGIFDNVITLINAFNKAISEKANDVEYYADAYLLVLGAELDEENLKTLRDSRIINLKDPDTTKLIVEFLQKPDADGTQENLLNRLEDLIFRTAMVVNLSDEKFGNSSGVSLRYKLQAMDNLAKTKERKFTSGMNRRYKIISTFPTSDISGDEWASIKYKFTRNVPDNMLEESQIVGALKGILSDETLLAMLSSVDNPKAELERIKAEFDESSPYIPRVIANEQT